MKSSFTRKGAGASADVGTRPGLHGQTLISSGWADLDKTLLGGIPLGSLTLLLEDLHSQQHLNFIRYFLAEAVTTKQPAAWFAATEPDGGAASFLPALITDTQPTSSAATSAATASGADGGDGDLRIAWQYRKYLQTAQKQREQEQAEAAAAERQAKLKAAAGGGGAGGSGRTAAEKAVSAGIAKQWCHSYDLTRSMDTGLVTQHGLVCHVASDNAPLTSTVDLAEQFISRYATPTDPIAAAAATRTPPGRVVIQSLLSPAWQPPLSTATTSHTSSTTTTSPHGSQQHTATAAQTGSEGVQGSVHQGVTSHVAQNGYSGGKEQGWREAARVLFRLRRAVQGTRCAVLVTIQAESLPPTWLTRLQHLAHSVLALGSLSDSSDVYRLLPDPTTASALLSVVCRPSLGMLSPPTPDTQLYVIRNKRRKLTITPVEEDPDAEVRQRDAVEAVIKMLTDTSVTQSTSATDSGAKANGVGVGGAGVGAAGSANGAPGAVGGAPSLAQQKLVAARTRAAANTLEF